MTFLDTSFFAALAMGRDALHASAVAWSERLPGLFVTTEYVLVEFVNLLSMPGRRRPAHSVVANARANPAIQVVPATAQLFDAGLALHGERSDKSWSLTDCISFVVMAEHGITDALTGDHHFEQAGFRALLKE